MFEKSRSIIQLFGQKDKGEHPSIRDHAVGMELNTVPKSR